MKEPRKLQILIEPQYTGLNDYGYGYLMYEGTPKEVKGCLLQKAVTRAGWDLRKDNNFVGCASVRLDGIEYFIENPHFVHQLTREKADKDHLITFIEVVDKK